MSISEMPVDARAREAFFGKKVTVLTPVGFDKTRTVGRLEQLGFSYDIVECDDLVNLELFHRGDVLHGRRIEYFFEYADWLRRH